MKICLDVTPVTPKPSGVGLYILSLVEELARRQSEQGFELFLSYQPRLLNWARGAWEFPPQLQSYTRKKNLPVPVRLSNLLLRDPTGLVGRGLTQYLASPDIIHGTNYSVYPLHDGCRVMTVYDMSFGLYPEYATSVSQAYFESVQRCLKWTDLVITISESSKQDVIKYYGISPKKVWVTPLASRYNLMSCEKTTDDTVVSVNVANSIERLDFQKKQPYILFVSTIEPRKNVRSLIQAFEILKDAYRLEHQLILIGQKGWRYEPIFEAIERSSYKKDIHHLSYLSDDEVVWFYRNADVFAYPSYYEGFGMPVLEAMTLGCPVVTSNTSSLPEVAGDAALTFDPTSVDEIVAALRTVIQDRAMRSNLIEKGYQQAASFSWENTAKMTLEAYQAVIV